MATGEAGSTPTSTSRGSTTRPAPAASVPTSSSPWTCRRAATTTTTPGASSDMPQKTHVMHGRDHGRFGADPLPAGPWHYVGATREPPFQNGWDNIGDPYQVMRFRELLDEGIEIQGSVTGGASGTVIFTLPVRYRPVKRLRMAASNSDDTFVILEVR